MRIVIERVEMAHVRNKLPVAVHHESGGSARMRVGGTVVSLAGVSSGSFRVTGGTGYRLCYSGRGMGGFLLLVGYTSPVTLANASVALMDLSVYEDNVPEGATVYLATISPGDLTPALGDAGDAVYASFYR